MSPISPDHTQYSGYSGSGTRSGYSRAERFVRTHLVVLVAEAVETHLLLAAVGRRRPRGLGLQHPVHALVPPVLLRLAGLDPLQLDAQLQPPRCQLAEAAGAGRGERTAVVAPQTLWQPVLLEQICNVARVAAPDTWRCPAQASR